MRINQTGPSPAGQNQTYKTNRPSSGNLEKFPTGLRVNRFAEQESATEIKDSYRQPVHGAAATLKNVRDKIETLNSSEGTAQEVPSVLKRMRELAQSAASDGSGKNFTTISYMKHNASHVNSEQQDEAAAKVKVAIGAYVKQLDRSANALLVSKTNQQAAESLIRDTNLAEKFSVLTGNQIESQPATAILAQSGVIPQPV